MTREDIIRMADKQGLVDYFDMDGDSVGQLMLCTLVFDCIAAEQKKWQDQAMVDIHEAVLEEREACAKVCDAEADEMIEGEWTGCAIYLANNIRARGQQ